MRKLPEWEREPTHEPDGSSEDCHYLSWGKYLSPVGFWEQYALIYRASVCLERDDISTCRRTLAALAASFKNDLSHVIENQMLFRLLDQLLIRGERDAVLNFIGSIAQTIESKRAVQQWRRWEKEIRNGKSPRIEWPKRLERSYRKQVHSRR